MDDKIVGNYLLSLGISPKHDGFRYIIEAIKLYPQPKMTDLYSQLHQSPLRVERCIRYAIGFIPRDVFIKEIGRDTTVKNFIATLNYKFYGGKPNEH